MSNMMFYGHNQSSFSETIITQGASASFTADLIFALDDLIIDWGDGSSDTFNDAIINFTHNYAIQEVHTITILSRRLEVLAIGNNNITNIDVSEQRDLKRLDMNTNNLTSIDVTSNTELNDLNVSYNNISTIDTSQNINLDTFIFSNCGVSIVNIANNSDLISIFGDSNNLNSLVVNKILEKLDGFGLSGATPLKSVSLASQSPLAPPTGSGITAKNNLIAKDWQVATD